MTSARLYISGAPRTPYDTRSYAARRADNVNVHPLKISRPVPLALSTTEGFFCATNGCLLKETNELKIRLIIKQ